MQLLPSPVGYRQDQGPTSQARQARERRETKCTNGRTYAVYSNFFRRPHHTQSAPITATRQTLTGGSCHDTMRTDCWEITPEGYPPAQHTRSPPLHATGAAHSEEARFTREADASSVHNTTCMRGALEAPGGAASRGPRWPRAPVQVGAPPPHSGSAERWRW